MNVWGWRIGRPSGFRDGGLVWLQPFVTAVPWITVGLLFVLMCRVGDTFTLGKGVVFDLPESGGLPEGAVTPMVALVMPDPKETLRLKPDYAAVPADLEVRVVGGRRLALLPAAVRQNDI